MRNLLKSRAKLTPIAAVILSLAACGGGSSSAVDEVANSDDPNASEVEQSEVAVDMGMPQLTIQAPSTSGTYSTTQSSIGMNGAATDDRKVSRVTWVNSRGGSGIAVKSGSGSSVTWSVTGLTVASGENTIVVRAYDGKGNRATKSLVVTRSSTATTGSTTTTTTPTTTPTTTASSSSWTKVSNEYAAFTVSGTTQARYGLGSSWVQKTVSGAVSCGNAFFGSDPAVGQLKQCDVVSTDLAKVTISTPVTTASTTPTTTTTSSTSPTTTSGTTTTSSGSTGTSSGTTTSGTTTGTGGTPSTTPATGSVASIAGVTIDVSKIPTGSAGVNYDRVISTGEQPGGSDGTGSFRTACNFSHMAFDDPIVYPGQPGASHLHAFFGNTGANANSTPNSIATTGNSTCRGGTLNRSAYWVPAMIDTRNGAPVKPREGSFYYKTGYGNMPTGNIQGIPAGLRFIAGDPKATAPTSTSYFLCMADGQHKSSIPPNCPAGSEVWMVVMFPQCWDGVNLDSPDHKSHMSYRNGSNVCPASHPVAIPEITQNVMHEVKVTGETAYWRLSSDNYTGPAGYSAHGDWMNGWKQEFSNMWLNNCLRPAKDCHSHLLGGGLAMDFDF